MKNLFLTTMVLASICSYAQTTNCDINLSYEKTLATSGTDQSNFIAKTIVSGYIIAGKTNVSGGFGSDDAILTKLDSAGNIVWSNRYGGNSNDNFRKVIQTSDSGYAAIGQTASTNIGTGSSTLEMFIVRTNSAGQLIWSKRLTFGTPSYQQDICMDIIQTEDKGYAIAGIEKAVGGVARYVVIKMDSVGNIVWGSRLYTGLSNNDAFSVVENGNTIVAAGDVIRTGNSQYDLAVTVFDKTSGNILNTYIYTITSGRGFFAPRIFKQNSLYFISAHIIDGNSYSNMNIGYIKVSQTDFSISTSQYLTHSGGIRNDGNAGILPLSNGSIVAYNSETLSNSFAHTYTISNSNTLIRADRYGNGLEKVAAIAENPSGGLFITGSTNFTGDMFLIKTNNSQTIPCNYSVSDAIVNNLPVNLVTGFSWSSTSVTSSNINSITPIISAVQIDAYVNCQYNPCSDTVSLDWLSQKTWLLSGNDITANPGSFLGTINNADLKFATNNTQRAVIRNDGNFGISTTSPTAKLHINCSNPANISNIRLENLNSGKGDFLVIDSNGYVMRSNAIVTKKTIKNLQLQIDELKKQIESLQTQSNTSNFSNNTIISSESQLFQSMPNPASSGEIKIGYTVIKNAQNAYIFITNSSGVQVRKFVVYPGSGQITLNTSSMVSGEYLYTLTVDNKIIDTKKLQVLR